MMKKQYDLIVVGGGTSGWPAALSAARNGVDVLLVEQLGFLGGTATASYVTPMMKTILKDGTNLAGKIYFEILDKLKQEGFASSNFDGNPGWFAPEMLKFAIEELLLEAQVNILYHSQLINCKVENKTISSIDILNKAGIQKREAKFFIDATGDANLAEKAGVNFEVGHQGKTQAMSHRFVMAGVDVDKFAQWLKEYDPDPNVSPVFQTQTGDILLTTAYTSEDKPWALKPLFMEAISKQILEPCDAEYFQIFTAPGQKGLVFFNCPRIYSEKPLSPLNPEDISYAQILGKKQIKRLCKFVQLYLPGFEKAYISNVAPEIGIRDSRRIAGKYILTKEDIMNARKFKNAVARSNYPIDIHSTKPGEGGLRYLKENDYYEIPLECLQTNEIDNLMVVGKSISAEFEAQASLRVQPTLITIGESAGIAVAKHIKNS